MRIPGLLKRLQCAVRHAIDPALLDKHGTWIHYREFRLLIAAIDAIGARYARRVDTSAFRLELMGKIAPFTRVILPDTELSKYFWTYQVQAVQEVIWLRPEFVAGFRYATSGAKELERGSNPYSRGDSRANSWDTGYIIGLAVRYPKCNKLGMKNWLHKLADLQTRELPKP